MAFLLEALPVELITAILEELDVATLITISYLSRRLHHVASDPALNPWRRPILRNLLCGDYEDCLKHLSVRTTVPRQNWIEILSFAHPSFLLFDATLPNMKEADWELCFKRRFLPGWQKWKRDLSWCEVYKRMLFRVWHRTQTTCTSDESWTKYIVLNRNGSSNELESFSRNFNPLAIFNDMKIQSNLAHLETHIRLVVQLADVRVIALGVLNIPRGTFTINKNARAFLHPPGLVGGGNVVAGVHNPDSPSSHARRVSTSFTSETPLLIMPQYERMSMPIPAPSHAHYPFYTPGGEDKRWFGTGPLEENGQSWVGALMLTAQVVGPQTRMSWNDSPPLQDLDLVLGPGRNQYASFTWADLEALAPWMEERITKKVTGPGLGN
ncbi:hypothetical protein OF83DRAFT_1161811 [Amylostereum chailletii]|nr:hypothetical protein OF83DRAFT_1161811 [Amylostereum chailletii]